MQISELLAQIDELKAEIDKLRPLKPEVEHRIMQKFRLDWNYHSNAIEGNSLTLGETRAFLMEGLTASGKPLKDHLDIKGHNELIDFLILFIRQKEELTEAAIREMHKILLREPYETEAVTLDGRIVKKLVKLGEYKVTPNFVRTGSGQIHQYAQPEDVPPRMKALLDWYRNEKSSAKTHPVEQAAVFHHQFLSIHPFDDGNGRLGRILMNLILMRGGFPPAVIRLSERDQYIAALRQADTGEAASIVQFVGSSLMKSETLYLRGAKGEPVEEIDDVDHAVALLKQELAHVEEPQEITQERLKNILNNTIKPLAFRVATKLKQFDELFAKESISLSTERYMDSSLRSFTHGNTFSGSKGEYESLYAHLELQKPVRSLKIQFGWEGFRKGGLNDFGVGGLLMVVLFEQRKYSVQIENTHFKRILMYQNTLSRDEEDEIVNLMAKKCLDAIQAQLKKQA